MTTAHSTVAPMNIRRRKKIAASPPLETSHSSKHTEELNSVDESVRDWDDSLSLPEVDYSGNEWKRVVAAWNTNHTAFDPFIKDTARKSPDNNASILLNEISNYTTKTNNTDDELPLAPTALGEIFALASIHRSCVRPAVADFCGICTSLATENAIESVTTSVIASLICKLNLVIASKAEDVIAAESEELLNLLTRWNTELEQFQWDGDTGQFRAPLNVNNFRLWIYENFPTVDERGFDIELLMLIRPGNRDCNVKRHAVFQGLLKDGAPTGSASSPPSTTANEDICIDKEVEQTMMRESMELAVTHLAETDTLDFLWDDPEDDDSIYDDEFEDSDTERDVGIFDSATEISGADVTESDWSEIN